jgi:EAL domain-containing protein (putative c-di-GMP-specific phosphodiesterase class I)
LDAYRILGFAFASADLLFELDPDGRVAFAVGATHALATSSETALVGRGWRELVAEPDHAMVEAMFAGLGEARFGPVTIQLARHAGQDPAFAALSICRLPPQKNISCAMALYAATPVSARAGVDADGYQDRAGFETLAKTMLSAASAVGQELDLALIELPGLSAALSILGPQKATALLQRFAGALRAEAYGGAPAARLGEERFAVIRPKGRPPERIEKRLNAAMSLSEAAELSATAQVFAVEPGPGALDRSLRALRYAIENFAGKGVGGLAGASLNEAFTRSVQQTLAQAGEFGAAVKARQFNLVFQPVVSLKTGRASHFETLVRFQDDTSPYKLIRMAEELDLILELDLAIVEQTLDRLKADASKALKLAVNVSGRSIMDPWFIAEVRRLAAAAGCAERLIFEVTESVAIDNLTQADRHIQQLRGDGHLVCLDDFGAGASSYAYLQKLHVDVIKIDGRYVKELAEGGRDDALVRHLVNLCGELGVTTIAEMVVSPAVEAAARAAGVDFAQGFLYGQPSAEPRFEPKPTINAKRKGVLEQWG